MDLQAFCLSVCTCLLQAGSTPFLILLCKLLLHVVRDLLIAGELDRELAGTAGKRAQACRIVDDLGIWHGRRYRAAAFGESEAGQDRTGAHERDKDRGAAAAH